MRAQLFTTVYAVILVLCLATPKVLSATTSWSDTAWLVNFDLGEEESEEESQEEKAEAEFYLQTDLAKLPQLPNTIPFLPACYALNDSLYHPEVFAPPPEVS